MSESESSKPIVIVDPDPASRNAGEDLEDDLECHVVAVDSMEFDPEVSEEILEAEAFIVCWDLGIRSGADLIEQIRTDERLRDRIVIAALDRATRGCVRSAISLGADGICLRPYDASEVGRRLDDARKLRCDDEAA